MAPFSLCWTRNLSQAAHVFAEGQLDRIDGIFGRLLNGVALSDDFRDVGDGYNESAFFWIEEYWIAIHDYFFVDFLVPTGFCVTMRSTRSKTTKQRLCR